ncbi:MAG: bifunctional folylpolyglutamate synthase/dihydrofolate synthase [Deltaproteobacteria bacterium]|nr:bifunctional folylpolyglutamate synthase/dihydrofolate synthase [Deltaproteobacteria bacterium]
MTYDELIRGLWALGHAQGMRLGLERVEAAAAQLGRPNLACPAVHVAGTDGKGSVAHVASRILGRHGLHVGLTTSPHLHRLTERIRVDGDEIPREELAAIATAARERLGAWEVDGPLTFFEVVTLLAFDAFRRRAVDVAVVEVGLGGRLDATRLCRPAVSVVTSIGLDHTEQLGNTLAAIAGEKAGIFAPGVPVVLGPLAPEALAVAAARAEALGCPCVRWDDAAGVFVRVFPSEARSAGGPPPLDVDAVNYFARALSASPPLEGFHQRSNAAVAAAASWVALGALGRSPDRAAFAVPPFVLPGRLERGAGRPPILIDVAHNPHGAAALAVHLAADPSLRPRFVLGTLATKDVDGIARALWAEGRVLHACAPAMPNVHPAARVAAAWPGTSLVHGSVVEALAAARAAAGPDELVVVTGSHYTVAEARAALLGIVDVDRPIAL